MEMTKHEKMKALVEASGGCWHEWEGKEAVIRHCLNCGVTIYNTIDGVIVDLKKNPSPDSVDDLLVVADRLGYRVSITKYTDGWYAKVVKGDQQIDFWNWLANQKDTPAEALLEALWQAKFGGE